MVWTRVFIKFKADLNELIFLFSLGLLVSTLQMTNLLILIFKNKQN